MNSYHGIPVVLNPGIPFMGLLNPNTLPNGARFEIVSIEADAIGLRFELRMTHYEESEDE